VELILECLGGMRGDGVSPIFSEDNTRNMEFMGGQLHLPVEMYGVGLSYRHIQQRDRGSPLSKSISIVPSNTLFTWNSRNRNWQHAIWIFNSAQSSGDYLMLL
jgi:hypothetical protein